MSRSVLRPVLLVLVVLVGAVPGSLSCGRSAPATLTIVHFNDVYEIGPVEGGRVGGLARVATVIGDLRRTSAPVLTTLGGDFLSPSALASPKVDGEAIGGRQMVDVLNAVGLDWATLGNHEFDLPEPAFRARLEQSTFGVVTSNVTDVDGAMFPHTESFVVVPVTVGGRTLRIGLIGLTIEEPRAWVRFAPVVESARAAIAKMQEAGPVDAIVALTHLPLTGDEALVTAVPEIDVVLGGHEHENWLLHRGSHLTPIVKADSNVRTLAIVSMTFPEGARPEVSVRLKAITSDISADAIVDAQVQRWTAIAFDAFRSDGFDPMRVVATLPYSLDGRQSVVRNRPGNLTSVIADALAREAAPVDVAIINGGSIRLDDELSAGPVTEYDVIRTLPFGGGVIRVSMPGSLLIKVLEAGIRNRGNGGYLNTWGITRDGDRWLVQGTPLGLSVRYTVAMPEFLMTGRETNLAFLTRTHPLIGNIQDLHDIRQAVITELSTSFPVTSR
jgi:5'-nucleotidase / UDP-sugar diphosphatase